MSYSQTLKAVEAFQSMMPSIASSCEFHPRKHPFKTYGAQQRDAKRRKKAKNHKK